MLCSVVVLNINNTYSYYYELEYLPSFARKIKLILENYNKLFNPTTTVPLNSVNYIYYRAFT